jgi:hypothetical protein
VFSSSRKIRRPRRGGGARGASREVGDIRVAAADLSVQQCDDLPRWGRVGRGHLLRRGIAESAVGGLIAESVDQPCDRPWERGSQSANRRRTWDPRCAATRRSSGRRALRTAEHSQRGADWRRRPRPRRRRAGAEAIAKLISDATATLIAADAPVGPSSPQAPTIGQEASGFEPFSASGDLVRLADFRGRDTLAAAPVDGLEQSDQQARDGEDTGALRP